MTQECVRPVAMPKDDGEDLVGLTPSLQYQQSNPATAANGGLIGLATTSVGGGNKEGLEGDAALARKAFASREVASHAAAHTARLQEAGALVGHGPGPKKGPLDAAERTGNRSNFEEVLCELLKGAPRTFKDLYPLVAEREPKLCPGSKRVNTDHMEWLYDLERDLRNVAVNVDGNWHLKKNIPLHSSSRVVEHPTLREGKRSKKRIEKAIQADLEKLTSKNSDSVPSNKDIVVAPATTCTPSTKFNSDGKGTPRIRKESIKEILCDGKEVSDQKYNEHCRFNHLKTFYFFCMRLASEPTNFAVSARDLNEFITARLRRSNIVVKNRFNPEGWFGKAWTDWNNPSKNEKHFRPEYCEILVRTGQKPYFYQLRPEYFGLVKACFAEFESVA
jgi:hypothetical protein